MKVELLINNIILMSTVTYHLFAYSSIGKYLIITIYNDDCWYSNKKCKNYIEVRKWMSSVPLTNQILSVISVNNVQYIDNVPKEQSRLKCKSWCNCNTRNNGTNFQSFHPKWFGICNAQDSIHKPTHIAKAFLFLKMSIYF